MPVNPMKKKQFASAFHAGQKKVTTLMEIPATPDISTKDTLNVKES
jgi:hypothetical protein